MIGLVKNYWHDFWYSPEKAALQLRVFFGAVAVGVPQLDLTWLPHWVQTAISFVAIMLAFATKAGERNVQP